MSKRYIFIAAIIVVVIAGSVWLIRSNSAPKTAIPAEKNFSLTIADKAITSGDTTLKVGRGDYVTITITTDEEEEFHVHGYDTSVDIGPDAPATLTFTADKTGRFPFELEGSKTELGALEVAP